MELNNKNTTKNCGEGISLIECEIGREFVVLKVNAGFQAKTRLADLGIVPGVNIIIMTSAPFRGPIEIDVKGSCLVIGRGLAAKIIVKNKNVKSNLIKA